tara:strand:+ start:316 stop:756 length:441 start_codon:yes stop_codon:yes gene_type:complete
LAAKNFALAIIRNKFELDGGYNCPIVVEGLKDEKTLRILGFTGIIEKINRGWNQSKLVAYLHKTYSSFIPLDNGPAIILLMDWDRTGGKIQKFFRDQLMSLDVPIDEDLRDILIKTMKPEGKTVESIRPYSDILIPLIEDNIKQII